jgi:branched-chain amino acid transport system substrate-binding protein
MRRVVSLTAVLLAAAALVAGCGTSGSSSSSSSSSSSPSGSNASASSSSGGSTATSSTSATTGGSLTGVQTALAYTHGKAGAAKSNLSPITLGFAAQSGGNPSNPDMQIAAQAAAQYINDQLGGVDGHPVKLQVCNIVQSEEQAQTCAQQFLNTSAVPLITTGGLNNGNQAFYQTLGGKVPVIEGVAGNPVDATAKNSLVLSAGVLGVSGAMTAYIKARFHPKTVSIVAPQISTTQLAVKALTAGLEKQGVKVTAATFPANASDVTAPLLAANAKDADVLAAILFPPQCPTVAKALKELGRTGPVVSLDLCISPTLKQAYGGDFPLWNYLAIAEIPYSKHPSTNIVSYLAGMKKYAGPQADTQDYAVTAWGAMLTADRIMNGLGAANVSRANVAKAFTHFSAPTFLTPAATSCGKIPGLPGLCSPSLFFYKYSGSGNFTDESLPGS